MSVDQTPAVPFALWLRPPRNASLFGVIAGRTVGNVFFRVTGLGLTFMLSIVLARALRSEQYGVYVLCMTWTTLLGTLATLGLPSVAMRGTARARANGDYRAIWSLAVFTYLAVAAAGCCVAAAAGAFVLLAHALGIAELWRGALLVAALSIPVACIAQVTGAFLCGYERILTTQIPETLLRPSLFLVFLTGSWLTNVCVVDAEKVLLLHLALSVASLLLGFALLWRVVGRLEWQRLTKERLSLAPRAWMQAGIVLMLCQVLVNSTTQVDILMLGWLASTDEVGLYYAASRGALLITLVFGAMTGAAGPTFARLWAAGRHAELQALTTACTRSTFAIALVVGGALLLGAKEFLGLFGPGFVPAEHSFRILLMGWLGAVACGPSAILLIMTAFERAALKSLAAGLATNVALNAVLIPAAGLTGAAAATAVSVGFYHLALCRAAYRLTGIHAHCLARQNPGTMTR